MTRAIRFSWLLFLLLLAFQNCTLSAPISFHSLSSSPLKINSSGGGNGDAYEGKPLGTFVRTLPEPICSPLANEVFSTLEVTATLNRLEYLDPTTCTKTQQIIADSQLQFNRLHPMAIGLDDGLYVNQLWLDKNTPHAIEGWCHSSGPAPLAEFSLLLVAGPASGRQLQILSPVLSLSLNVTRTLKDQRLSYESPGITLQIETQASGSAALGVLRANLTSSRPDLGNLSPLDCRIGQDLDGVIWPSRPLRTPSFFHSQIFNKGQSALLLSKHPDGYNQLSRFDVSSGQSIPLTGVQKSGLGPLTIPKIDPSETYAVFYNHKDELHNYDFASVKLDGTGFNILSNPSQPYTDGLFDCGQNIFTADRIVFLERSSIGVGCFLRSAHLDGSGYRKLYAETDPSLHQVRSFVVDKARDEIYFELGALGTPTVSMRVKPDGRNMFRLGPYHPTAIQLRDLGLPMLLSRWPDDKIPPTPGFDFGVGVFSFDPDTNSVSPLIANPSAIISRSPDGRHLLISNFQGGVQVLDSVSGTVSSLYDYSPAGLGYSMGFGQFTADSRYLIFTLNREDPGQPSKEKLFMSSADGTSVKRLSNPDQTQVRILNVDEDRQSILYYAKEPSGLGSINKVSLDGSNPTIIVKSQALEKGITNWRLPATQDRLFFMADSDGDSVFELFVLYFNERGLQQINNRFVEYGSVIAYEVINPQKVIFTTTKQLSDGSKRGSILFWREGL